MPDMSEFHESMDEMEGRCDAQRDDEKLDASGEEHTVVAMNTLRYTALGLLRKNCSPELAKVVLKETIEHAKVLGLGNVATRLEKAIETIDESRGTAICLIDGGHDFIASRGGCGYCGATYTEIWNKRDCLGRLVA
jgi:hypothetical protein